MSGMISWMDLGGSWVCSGAVLLVLQAAAGRKLWNTGSLKRGPTSRTIGVWHVGLALLFLNNLDGLLNKQVEKTLMRKNLPSYF